MSKECQVCGKKRASGNNVSHSNRKTKRVFNPNIQSVNLGGMKIKVCAKCIKSLGKKI